MLGYGTVAADTAQMDKIRRDRRGTKEEDVQNLGDEAVWSTSTVTLLVRRGHLVLSITLEKDDKPHENLNKAKALADSLAGIESGALLNKSNSLQAKIEQSGKRVDSMNTRLDKQRERLLKQFYNMESAVAKLQKNLTAINQLQIIPPLGSQ